MVKKIYNLKKINHTQKYELSVSMHLMLSSIVHARYSLVFRDYAFLMPVPQSRSPPFNLSDFTKNYERLNRNKKIKFKEIISSVTRHHISLFEL